MIADVTNDVRDRMSEVAAKRGETSGVSVEFGPVTPRPDIPTRCAVRVFYDDDRGDAYAVPGSTHGNPSSAFRKGTGCVAVIEAVDGKAGATEENHRWLAEKIADSFIVALRVVAERRKNTATDITGRFDAPAADTTRQVGAFYELRFTWGRAVLEHALATGTGAVPGITTRVTNPTGTTTETACAPVA